MGRLGSLQQSNPKAAREPKISLSLSSDSPDHLPLAIMLHIMHSNGLKWQRFVYKMTPFLRKPNSLHTITGLLIEHKIHNVTEVGPHIPALLSILRSDLPIYQLRSKAWGAQYNRT